MDLVDKNDKRLELLLPALDNETTPEQALAVNTLLGVNFIHNPLSRGPAMSAVSGMCRLGSRRQWDFPGDHGLHCNMVTEWCFAVGTFDVGTHVVGYELMIHFRRSHPARGVAAITTARTRLVDRCGSPCPTGVWLRSNSLSLRARSKTAQQQVGESIGNH